MDVCDDEAALPPAPEPPSPFPILDTSSRGRFFLSPSPVTPPPRIASSVVLSEGDPISTFDIGLVELEEDDPYYKHFERVHVDDDSTDGKEASKYDAVSEPEKKTPLLCFCTGLIFASFCCLLAFVPLFMSRAGGIQARRKKRYYVAGATIGLFVFAALVTFLYFAVSDVS